MLRGALGKQLGRLPSHLLPFQNGILNTITMEVLEHSPERFSAWCLPYDYDALATCGPVQEWLKESLGGENSLVNVMRAYFRAIITRRTSIQKFLELLGPGGTGKSTLINLAVAIVGESNTAVTELKHLESSRFEAAKLAGKRLIVITDADRYGGQVATLKALVGQDQVRWGKRRTIGD